MASSKRDVRRARERTKENCLKFVDDNNKIHVITRLVVRSEKKQHRHIGGGTGTRKMIASASSATRRAFARFHRIHLSSHRRGTPFPCFWLASVSERVSYLTLIILAWMVYCNVLTFSRRSAPWSIIPCALASASVLFYYYIFVRVTKRQCTSRQRRRSRSARVLGRAKMLSRLMFSLSFREFIAFAKGLFICIPARPPACTAWPGGQQGGVCSMPRSRNHRTHTLQDYTVNTA